MISLHGRNQNTIHFLFILLEKEVYKAKELVRWNRWLLGNWSINIMPIKLK